MEDRKDARFLLMEDHDGAKFVRFDMAPLKIKMPPMKFDMPPRSRYRPISFRLPNPKIRQEQMTYLFEEIFCETMIHLDETMELELDKKDVERTAFDPKTSKEHRNIVDGVHHTMVHKKVRDFKKKLKERPTIEVELDHQETVTFEFESKMAAHEFWAACPTSTIHFDIWHTGRNPPPNAYHWTFINR